MDEYEWYALVDEILEERGVQINDNDAGWDFFFQNGHSAEETINIMLKLGEKL